MQGRGYMGTGQPPLVVRGCDKEGRCGTIDGWRESGFVFYESTIFGYA